MLQLPPLGGANLESVVARLSVGALVGLAVGVEREWSGHATGPSARFAGVRTFLLLGGIGSVGGWFAVMGHVVLAAIVLGGSAGLVIAAYIMAARRDSETSVEGTTEVAALAVLAFGTVAGLGYLRIASAAAAIMVLALVEKTRIEGFVQRIGREEMRGALAFAVFALVVLPILPEGPYGPLGGIRPRALWAVVLLFLALDFGGYLARRAAGADAGVRIMGLLGGTISSTAVAFNFSQRSRHEAEMSHSLGIGVVGACTVLLPRVALVAVVLNPNVAAQLVPFLLPPLAVGAGILALDWYRFKGRARDRPEDAAPPEDRNPLRLGAALRMAAALQAVLMAIHFVDQTFGNPGILVSAALLGLTDMDALTLSMIRIGQSEAMVGLAARAIAIGILSNTALKLTVTLALGATAFRRVASVGLALLALGTVAGLWIGW